MARKKFPTYEEFLAFAKTHERCCLTAFIYNQKTYRTEPTLLEDVLGHDWTTGGWCGCNGYDQDSSCTASGSEGDQEPEWKTLVSLIEKFYPKLSFLQYHAMMKKLAHFSQHVENECYGGGHIHAYKHIELKALYDWLAKESMK